MIREQKAKIAELLSGVVEELGKDEIESLIEIPPEQEMGDFAFPCFKLAKTMRTAPPRIAEMMTCEYS